MALGKELFFFFEKSLPRASTQALGKGIFLSLCRGPPTMALGKEMFQNFSNESLSRAMGRPSAKDPSLPRALVIALGKEAEIKFFFVFCIPSTQAFHIYISHRIHFLTIYHNHNCEPQITIYYNDKSHVYYDKLMKSKHKSQP